jgi:soluble lytic murein transglycosylase-like protein
LLGVLFIPHATAAPIVNSEVFDLDKLVEAKAEEHGVSVSVMKTVIQRESQWDVTAVGDLDLTCKSGVNAGKPVRARGLVQITDCYHPDISDEQAFNPEFAVEFLAIGIAEGRCRKEWTTCPI